MASVTTAWWTDRWAWGLLVAAALLWLPNLPSSGLLWEDEAETAVLAKNTLTFGYPKAFDGVNRVNPALAVGPGGAWTYHTWLQFYLAAAAFWLFGTTTTAARLPFALIGVATVVMTYRVALAWRHHHGIARLTSVLTLFSVPLILHARQCRYYALAVFGLLWVLWAYLQICEGRRSGWGWLTAGLLVLFHSHHGAFVPTVMALGIDGWFRHLWQRDRRQTFILCAILALAAAPWLFMLQIRQHHHAWSGREFARHLQFYARECNHYVIPLFLLLGLWLLRLIRPIAWWRAAHTDDRARVRLLLWILGCHAVFLIAIPWQRHFRYLIHLVPLLYLIEAAVLWRWLGRRPVWLAIVATLLITTDLQYSTPNVLAQTIPAVRREMARHHHAPVVPRSLLAEYGYELTHRYRGPLSGIIETLRQPARPGDTVKIPYDDHAMMFYMPTLRVEDLNHFLDPTFPTWIIPRIEWAPGDFLATPYGQTIVRTYRRIDTNAPDLPWENRPDPGNHHFRTVEDAPHVVLYLRRDRV